MRRFYEDPGRRLGLPANAPANPFPRFDAPAQAAPSLEAFDRMDRNRDGFVSQDEFMAARGRSIAVRPQHDQRARSYQNRLDSRFRGADSNRDGHINPDEFRALEGRRF